MSFGLRRGRTLDPGAVAAPPFPPLPEHGLPGSARLDPRAWFPEPGSPLEIEVGSGKGTFLLARAAARPGVNLLGFEWAREFCDYAADRCRRAGLTNVRLVNGDATEFLHWRCPDAAASVVHLYFPDPWPKKRHHKRRSVTPRFLADVHRVLVPGGELRVVTDHDGYWSWMEERFAQVTGDAASFVRMPFEGGEDGGRGPGGGEGELVGTNFERKYRHQGRPFHATVLKNL
ncbi:MAG: tRNA (guanosine(46)-N7)-methyltransferase TrmB [Phycisphaerales bacterium]|nr:tRNA (guanosine(46)-N7)-methyltransferase TrmB [Phycisphaerales bacterium]